MRLGRLPARVLANGGAIDPQEGPGLSSTGVAVLAAVFNLNHPAHTVDWHFIHLSVANVVVIGLMLIVFVLVIVLPFPGAKARKEASR
jgi:hypothetical protein